MFKNFTERERERERERRYIHIKNIIISLPTTLFPLGLNAYQTRMAFELVLFYLKIIRKHFQEVAYHKFAPTLGLVY